MTVYLLFIMTIYSYVLTADNGCAPNIEKGVMSLNLCKPGIRCQANVGDIVFAVGGKPLHSAKLWKDIREGIVRKKIIYLMRVTQKITMVEYAGRYPERQDSIYTKELKLKNDARFHTCGGLIETDIGGQYTLLSNDFIYFGKDHIDVPDSLSCMIPGRQYLTTNSGKPLLSAELIEKQTHQLFQAHKL